MFSTAGLGGDFWPFRCRKPVSAYFLPGSGKNHAESRLLHRKTAPPAPPTGPHAPARVASGRPSAVSVFDRALVDGRSSALSVEAYEPPSGGAVDVEHELERPVAVFPRDRRRAPGRDGADDVG